MTGYARYLEHHESLGCKVGGYLSAWNMYCAPTIGTKPMLAVTPDDIKAIRDALTKRRLAGDIGAKRALNVWSDQIKAPFNRAFTDDDPKYSAVRVGGAKQNPTLGIKPPVTASDIEDDERERQPLEPDAFLQLMNCEALTVEFRRECAVKAYSGLRPAEIYGLRWPDVRLDVARPIIKVQRARDMKSGELVETKTKQSIRDVPIHPNLLPLLRVMRDEAADKKGLVFPFDNARVRDVEKNPGVLRDALRTAGIDTPELLEGTVTLMPFDDRSWRTTFATWCSKSGYDSAWVDVWLGHKPKTTAAKHYVKDTPHFADVQPKAVAADVTAPFPTLPSALLSRSGRVLAFWPQRSSNSATLECERRELNLRRLLISRRRRVSSRQLRRPELTQVRDLRSTLAQRMAQ